MEELQQQPLRRRRRPCSLPGQWKRGFIFAWTRKTVVFVVSLSRGSFKANRYQEADLKQITMYLCLAREFYHHHC